MAERRRAVEQNRVVTAGELTQDLLETLFPAVFADELHLDTHQIALGGKQVEIGKAGGADRGSDLGITGKDVVQVGRIGMGAEAAGGVALGITVHQEHAALQGAQAGPQIDRGGRLAHPTLLVCYGENRAHRVSVMLSGVR